MEERKLLISTAEVGARVRGRLLELQEKHSVIGDVRGMGLLQAIELVEDRRTKAPAIRLTAEMMEACRENRVLLGKGGMFGNVLRISPPMNISKSDVDSFAGALDAAFTRCQALVSGATR